MEKACMKNLKLFNFQYNFCVNIKWQEFKDGTSRHKLKSSEYNQIPLFIFLPKWHLPGEQQLQFFHSVQQRLQINVLGHQNSALHLCQV